MRELSSGLISKIDFSCNVTDITACMFIMLLMITAAVQKWNRNIHHFLSGLILLLNGISCQVLVRALEFAHRTDGGPAIIPDGGPGPGPAGTMQPAGLLVFENIKQLISMITAPGNADSLIRIISFIFVFISIDQFFLQAVSVREPFVKKHSGKYNDSVIMAVIMGAGIVICMITDREEVLTAIIMAYLIAGLCLAVKSEAFVLRRVPMIISVLIPVLACVLALAVPEMKFTGITLTIMYVFLYIEFHTYVETQLSARETELAESRIRLMNEQISSHFTFSSLKAIEDMCRTDPVKAGQTINMFSKYLRSNLENITAAEMIPFEDELEHTKQYIGFEQLKGSSSFDVQYIVEVSDFKVPPLVLEPLAENAIKHGVKEFGADAVTISTYINGDKIVISVSDNGKAGMQTNPGSGSRHRSVALENIRKRLEIQCEGILNIIYEEDGTTASITIPRINIELDNKKHNRRCCTAI